MGINRGKMTDKKNDETQKQEKKDLKKSEDKIQRKRKAHIVPLPPDHPIFKMGFITRGTGYGRSQKNVHGKNSKKGR